MARGILLCLIFSWICVNQCHSEVTESENKYMIKIREGSKHRLFKQLKKYNLTELNQITPETYIFKYNGNLEKESLLHRLLEEDENVKNEIVRIEPARVYDDDLKPPEILMDEDNPEAVSRFFKVSNDFPPPIERNDPVRVYDDHLKPPEILMDEDNPEAVSRWFNVSNEFPPPTNLVCEHYYGIGVEKAWSRGYTGRGIVVGITDVGVNTDIVDLVENINTDYSFNFVDNSTDVTPEVFGHIKARAAYLTDHGNKVASIIAAKKGNNMCSAGIAYNATIVALKIYSVQYVPHSDDKYLELYPRHWTSSEIIVSAFVKTLHYIDIFANAWASAKAFDSLDFATLEALRYSAENGRKGLGTIHVVPSGPPGSGLTNTRYTITVSSVWQYGTVPSYIHIDASVITSGLGEGNNLTTTSMVTASKNNNCVSTFNGVSAATAQIAAIISLALEANKNLSARTVQHLLVKSSERHELDEKYSFRKNAAGHYFHDYLGFGLINAAKLVKLAREHHHTQVLITKELNKYNERNHDGRIRKYTFCHTCLEHTSKNHCLTTVEHIEITMEVETDMRRSTDSDDFQIELISPKGTRSLLFRNRNKEFLTRLTNTVCFLSVHFWDEVALGQWSLLVVGHSYKVTIKEMNMTLYGTSNQTVVNQGLRKDYCGGKHASASTTTSIEKSRQRTSTKSYIQNTTTYSSMNNRKSNNTPVVVIVVVGVLGFVFIVVLIYISLKFIKDKVQGGSKGTCSTRVPRGRRNSIFRNNSIDPEFDHE